MRNYQGEGFTRVNWVEPNQLGALGNRCSSDSSSPIAFMIQKKVPVKKAIQANIDNELF